MGKKSGPKPPDPYQTAAAQQGVNKDAILTSALVNRYNTQTPWGSVTWDRPGQTVSAQPSPYQAPSPYQPSGSGFRPGRQTMIDRVGGPMPSLQSFQSFAPSVDPKAESLAGWTQRINLSPEMQRQFDQQNRRADSLNSLAMNRIRQIDRGRLSFNGLPGLVRGLDTSGMPELNKDYSADAERVEGATFDRAMMLLNPQFQERQRELDNRLAVMGLPVGGEAYGSEKERYDRMRNEAELAAALESVGAGRQEQSRLFGIDSAARGQLTQEQLANADLAQRARQQGVSERVMERTQPMNELAMLLGQVPGLMSPQAPQTAQYQAAPSDLAGMIQGNYNTRANQHSAKKGGTSGLAGALGSAAIMSSDRRLKNNIQLVGKMNGHRFYTWTWNEKAKRLGQTGKGFGVIADEIEAYAPHLITERNGYKAVDMGGIFNV